MMGLCPVRRRRCTRHCDGCSQRWWPSAAPTGRTADGWYRLDRGGCASAWLPLIEEGRDLSLMSGVLADTLLYRLLPASRPGLTSGAG